MKLAVGFFLLSLAPVFGGELSDVLNKLKQARQDEQIEHPYRTVVKDVVDGLKLKLESGASNKGLRGVQQLLHQEDHAARKAEKRSKKLGATMDAIEDDLWVEEAIEEGGDAAQSDVDSDVSSESKSGGFNASKSAGAWDEDWVDWEGEWVNELKFL
ncbi:hypothetical protein GNI_115770 [Gregarina niphandrodes]|uniref:Transmembrane protein n=1 Tax=Gregarina niphandrodes TaxID=110365 RepID=A0A023B3E4_GRENI|nr:hypothetical protein GNI_115770 [Gregarina niphandrodes]EZG55249.1 hypothetical protein GNI_115770 [Gregarina niphandrodes]|eukprot:XP_011131700.1 hypothetical protein GNI_115770 [Gregarina niphandrodes]